MKYRDLIIAFHIWCGVSCFAANPFEIDFPNKTDLSSEDYLVVQRQLRNIDVDALVEELYQEYDDPAKVPLRDFQYRCGKGARQTLLIPDLELYPSKAIEKIGQGGNRCVVCCVPYDGNYFSLISTIAESLRSSGFNGYFYRLTGGFPNPTGAEICFAGVPYCFKIFAMLEAYQLGFTSVLWIDSAMLPLRNPAPLFETIEKHGALIVEEERSTNNRYVLPATRRTLQQLTGVDVFETTFIRTMVFGMKMDTDLAYELIQSYYQMVSLGTPFLSCFPEEFVLSAIIGKAEFRNWNGHVMHNILLDRPGTKPEYVMTFDATAVVAGYNVYFYHRGHL